MIKELFLAGLLATTADITPEREQYKGVITPIIPSTSWLERIDTTQPTFDLKELTPTDYIQFEFQLGHMNLQLDAWQKLKTTTHSIITDYSKEWLLDNGCPFEEVKSCPNLDIAAFTSMKKDRIQKAMDASIEGLSKAGKATMESLPLRLNFYLDGSIDLCIKVTRETPFEKEIRERNDVTYQAYRRQKAIDDMPYAKWVVYDEDRSWIDSPDQYSIEGLYKEMDPIPLKKGSLVQEENGE